MTGALATRSPNGIARSDSLADWQILKEQAAMLLSTGFLPSAIKNAEQAIAIILKGRELGLPPMYSLSNISIINGKPCTGAEAIAALIYRDHGDHALIMVETTDERCVLKYKRRSWGDWQEFEFTAADAKRAGLYGKGTWTQYPATMLRWRAISAVGKLAFADTVGGLYTPEELGAEVQFDAQGEMEVISPPTAVKDSEPESTEPLPTIQSEYQAMRDELAGANDIAQLGAVWKRHAARHGQLTDEYVRLLTVFAHERKAELSA
jgi:hypothetical protein